MSKSGGAKQFGNKTWPHMPEALLRGRLVYNVKFYGDQEVSEAKGTEPIKEAVRKMKFNKQMKKSEGQKTTPKVELHINVDGLAIYDPKSKVQQFKFPLHHISYCADDKSEKKLFTFIAKDGATGKHHCFVLGSEKNAEEITLSIGQAFDLAYKKFIDRQNNQGDKQQQFFLLQQQVTKLQAENKRLRERVAELEGERNYTSALSAPSATSTTPATTIPATNGLASSKTHTQPTEPSALPLPASAADTSLLGDADFLSAPSKPFPGSASNGTKDSSSKAPPIPVRLAPPPASVRTQANGSSTSSQQPLIPAASSQPATAAPAPNPNSSGSVPATASDGQVDAFGMPSFGSGELMEFEDMRSGFSRGLSIGVADFDISALDPLSN